MIILYEICLISKIEVFLYSLTDLNLLDWSCCNFLAVALGGGVYIWNADDGSIVQLMELQTPDDYISSVNWVKEGGNILAVGTSTGSVQVLIVKCYID